MKHTKLKESLIEYETYQHKRFTCLIRNITTIFIEETRFAGNEPMSYQAIGGTGSGRRLQLNWQRNILMRKKTSTIVTYALIVRWFRNLPQVVGYVQIMNNRAGTSVQFYGNIVYECKWDICAREPEKGSYTVHTQSCMHAHVQHMIISNSNHCYVWTFSGDHQQKILDTYSCKSL